MCKELAHLQTPDMWCHKWCYQAVAGAFGSQNSAWRAAGSDDALSTPDGVLQGSPCEFVVILWSVQVSQWSDENGHWGRLVVLLPVCVFQYILYLTVLLAQNVSTTDINWTAGQHIGCIQAYVHTAGKYDPNPILLCPMWPISVLSLQSDEYKF